MIYLICKSCMNGLYPFHNPRIVKKMGTPFKCGCCNRQTIFYFEVTSIIK